MQKKGDEEKKKSDGGLMSSISSSVTGMFNGGESSREDKVSILDTSMVSQDMPSVMSPRN